MDRWGLCQKFNTYNGHFSNCLLLRTTLPTLNLLVGKEELEKDRRQLTYTRTYDDKGQQSLTQDIGHKVYKAQYKSDWVGGK